MFRLSSFRLIVLEVRAHSLRAEQHRQGLLAANGVPWCLGKSRWHRRQRQSAQ